MLLSQTGKCRNLRGISPRWYPAGTRCPRQFHPLLLLMLELACIHGHKRVLRVKLVWAGIRSPTSAITETCPIGAGYGPSFECTPQYMTVSLFAWICRHVRKENQRFPWVSVCDKCSFAFLLVLKTVWPGMDIDRASDNCIVCVKSAVISLS